MRFKTIVKLFIGVVLAILIIFALILWGVGKFVGEVIDANQEEAARVKALTEVSGLVCGPNDLIAPISGDSVAFYFIEYDYSYTGEGRTSGWGTNEHFPTKDIFCLNVEALDYTFEIDAESRVLYEEAPRLVRWNAPKYLARNEPNGIPENLLGINEGIDCKLMFMYRYQAGRKIEVECSHFSYNYSKMNFREYSWKKGDTLRLKAQLNEGEITLLH